MNGDSSLPKPHSRAWYETRGADYVYPWRQVLLGVSGESLFDDVLSRQLTKDCVVLEAGCAGGRDTQRFAPEVHHWVGYDFVSRFLLTARARNIPNASFVTWHSSKEVLPQAMPKRVPFDLIVSRRGPTSVIRHLSQIAAKHSRFIYVGPGGVDLLEDVRGELATVSWHVVWNAVIEARGFCRPSRITCCTRSSVTWLA
jgi:SAM-dependent methyltransferase